MYARTVSREVDRGSGRLRAIYVPNVTPTCLSRTSSASLLRFRPYLASSIVAGWQRCRTTGEGTKVYKKRERKERRIALNMCAREDAPGDRKIRSRKRRQRRWRWEDIVDRRTRSDVLRARTRARDWPSIARAIVDQVRHLSSHGQVASGRFYNYSSVFCELTPLLVSRMSEIPYFHQSCCEIRAILDICITLFYILYFISTD